MEHHFSASLSEGYTVRNTYGPHTWLSDEPETLGGSDAGPNPEQLLLSAIASCKLITMKMYAGRKEWKLDELQIELTLLRSTEGTTIREKITIEADLDDKQKARIKEIGGRCPIARIVTGPVLITELDD